MAEHAALVRVSWYSKQLERTVSVPALTFLMTGATEYVRESHSQLIILEE